ncbi:hypothetical protein ACFSX5_13455 [Devosia albogilva]|uniref:MobA/MobL protein domain-containing protein n=1 Tax=Devosia albogilva TaxID=429726 RepID=A0ABW5QMJ8_9HYPH
MPTGFVSVETVMAGTGRIVRRAAYNARRPVTVARNSKRYRPRSADDRLAGDLLIPKASSELGAQVDTFWNALDMAVNSTGPIGLDLILGLPTQDELELSEAVRLVHEFADPIVADGHAVQFDLHALPRPAPLGDYRHAHVLISLFGLDELKRMRRLETQWTPIFRASPGGYHSENLTNWRGYWGEVQSTFFRSQGLNLLRVPADVGLPEVRLGPRRLRTDASARLELANHRANHRERFSDDMVFLTTLASHSLLLEYGDIHSSVRSIFPTISPRELKARTERLIGKATSVRTPVGNLYGTTASIGKWAKASSDANRLANTLCTYDTIGVRPVEQAHDISAEPLSYCGKRLTVLVGSAATALVGSGPFVDDSTPLANLIEYFQDQEISLTLAVPDLRSRYQVRHLIDKFKLRCVTVAGLLTWKKAAGEKPAGDVLLVFDTQAVPDSSFANLLENAATRFDRLILTFDQSKVEQHPTHFLAMSVMDRFAEPVFVPVPRPNVPPSRFSWAKLGSEFQHHHPLTITGMFERSGMLSFGSVVDVLADAGSGDQIIVPDARTAQTFREALLSRDQHRAERLAQEHKLTLAGGLDLLHGDIVCLTKDRYDLPAGTLGRVDFKGGREKRWSVQWAGSRAQVEANSDDPIVHACVLSLRLGINRAFGGADSMSRVWEPHSRLVYVTRLASAERLMRFAATEGGLPVVINPAVATSARGLAEALSSCRAVGLGAAIAHTILEREGGVGDLLPVPSEHAAGFVHRLADFAPHIDPEPGPDLDIDPASVSPMPSSLGTEELFDATDAEQSMAAEQIEDDIDLVDTLEAAPQDSEDNLSEYDADSASIENDDDPRPDEQDDEYLEPDDEENEPTDDADLGLNEDPEI